MFYLPIIVIAAIATAGLAKRSPRTAGGIAAVALSAAAIAVLIAEVTGNLLLFYLGALLAPFGVFVLILCAARAVWRQLELGHQRRHQ